MKIGQKIRANKMNGSSFYLKAEGIITAIKNERIYFDATIVMDKWTKKWKTHPSSCSTSVEIKNAVII